MTQQAITAEQRQSWGLDTEYPLTEEQIASLHENSWTRLPGLLSREVCDALRAEIVNQPIRPLDALGKSYRKMSAEGKEQTTKPFLDHETDSKHNYNHEAMAWRNQLFRDVCTSRRLAGTVVRLMRRQEALLVQDISFYKPGGGGSPTAFHQDLPSWPFDRKGNITIWIALVDVDADMGPLKYLEGSHTEGPLGLAGKVDLAKTYPEVMRRKVVAGEALRAGDASAHWDLTVHGAGPNASERVREAYVVRYSPTETIYTGLGHPHYDNFNLEIGQPLSSSDAFPRVGVNGLLAPVS
jgi:ectoine hydroxylase-related dioxygenase (phytanoyl-CoA dioxygenase family)